MKRPFFAALRLGSAVAAAFLIAGALYQSYSLASISSTRRQFEFVYNATVPVHDQNARKLRVWIPLAASRKGQKILRREITVSDGLPYTIEKDPLYQNEMAYLKFEGDLPKEVRVSVNYEAVLDERLEAPRFESADQKLYLKPTRLMVINRNVRDIVSQAAKNATTRIGKARAIYDYVLTHMVYDKNEPGWGEGDTARACLVGKGNCTDFHSLFISSAMAANIPARFHIGFTVPPESGGAIKGYHCWAEFYDSEKGWITVDASEAWKAPEKRDFYFGGFDVNKFLLSTGRDLNLVPRQSGAPLNYFFYPYAELDGKESSGVTAEFSYRNLN